MALDHWTPIVAHPAQADRLWSSSEGPQVLERLQPLLKPRPDAPVVVRRLPTPRAVLVQPLASVPSAPSASRIDATTSAAAKCRHERCPLPEPPPTAIAPLAPERYRIQLTVSRETHDKFRRAQALLRHALPSGDAAEIFDRATTLLVDQLAPPTLRPD